MPRAYGKTGRDDDSGNSSNTSVAFYFKDAGLQLCWQSQDAQLIFAFLKFNKLPLILMSAHLIGMPISMFLKTKIWVLLVPRPLVVCKLAKFIYELHATSKPVC